MQEEIIGACGIVLHYYNNRAIRHRIVNERMPVNLISLDRDEHVPRLHFPGVVLNTSNLEVLRYHCPAILHLEQFGDAHSFQELRQKHSNVLRSIYTQEQSVARLTVYGDPGSQPDLLPCQRVLGCNYPRATHTRIKLAHGQRVNRTTYGHATQVGYNDVP
jgi:hypothetical protein